MARLSQRMSTVWSAVICPRCGTLVQPGSLGGQDGTADSTEEDDKRWSFLWRAPRGDICPECEFPLSKYFGRLKWIRTAVVGIAIVFAALVLQTIGVLGRFGSNYIDIMQGAVLVGATVTLVGIAGVVVGRRH